MPLFDALVATLEGYTEERHMGLGNPLKKIFPAGMLKESLSVLVGGGAAGAAFALAADKLTYDGKQLITGTLRRSALAVAMGLVGGRLLWNRGSRARDAAKGVMGAMSGVLGVEVLDAVQDAMKPKTAAPAGVGYANVLQGMSEMDEISGTYGDGMQGLGESTRLQVEDRVGGRALDESITVQEERGLQATLY